MVVSTGCALFPLETPPSTPAYDEKGAVPFDTTPFSAVYYAFFRR
ncbi:hypothetical protein [Salibacterium halotolerans]|nr:hypothetical protein [Salibacterium halotolerans]